MTPPVMASMLIADGSGGGGVGSGGGEVVVEGGSVEVLLVEASSTLRGTSSMVMIVELGWQKNMLLGWGPGQRYMTHAGFVDDALVFKKR